MNKYSLFVYKSSDIYIKVNSSLIYMLTNYLPNIMLYYHENETNKYNQCSDSQFLSFAPGISSRSTSPFGVILSLTINIVLSVFITNTFKGIII